MHISENRVSACLALAKRARTRAKAAATFEEQDVLSLRAERYDDRAWSMNEWLPSTEPLYN